MSKYREYKQLNMPSIEQEILQKWKDEKAFEKSISQREGSEHFVFYEGPPSANGMPGIHHVISRTLKDLVCRYKTMQGYQVKRKAGWDTHGLPVELGVEKELGITKEDIGKKITVEEYNRKCREAVMRYKHKWEEITEKMGYWVDMTDPYITFDNKYIETLWWALKQLYEKNLLYKSVSIQPYSPAAGTGLSSHELNQPGTYKDVKDTTVVAMFRLDTEYNLKNAKINDPKILDVESSILHHVSRYDIDLNIYFLAWTTTPWTLPSNCGLTVGAEISYVLLPVRNQYTNEKQSVIIAEKLVSKIFTPRQLEELFVIDLIGGVLSNSNDPFDGQFIDSNGNAILIEIKSLIKSRTQIEKFNDLVSVQNNPKGYVCTVEEVDENIRNEFPSLKFFTLSDFILNNKILKFKGSELEGLRYEQLLPYEGNTRETAGGDPWRVITGDFVTTEDGTGIVHTAPAFGADDYRVGKKHDIGILVMVDKEGKFIDYMGDLSGRYVKNYKDDPDYKDVDVDIAVKLKLNGHAFKVEKYEHTYPHCWRTDKPVIYYPLDAWFIRTTAVKDRMIELNKTINWKPKATGEGRFGNWLENMVDWNLSRSRFWGTPLPVWVSEDGTEKKCIGSIDELVSEAQKANKKLGLNQLLEGDVSPLSSTDYVFGEIVNQPTKRDELDLHKPFVDKIILVSDSGKPMHREPDLIDVWFDSGAMPYAQLHYPFENKKELKHAFPADFIAEGVDQTRGWFYTLHAIGVMLFDSVAYKTVVSNGLVLDKNGNKMSKRVGNVIDPFETLEKYSADATRWYLITNASPWDSLRFDQEGIKEVQRKYFGTLYNTYNFFALYANVDGFIFKEKYIPVNERPEIDRWILSSLQSLVSDVNNYLDDFEPTQAGRAMEYFLDEHLSNWYVRLCRRRFWKGEYEFDKICAYQTLYECLETLSLLMAPIAPFFADWLYTNLNTVTGRCKAASVHLADYPDAETGVLDMSLEERMQLAQDICSLGLSIRKKINIKVRQPLQKILVPVPDAHTQEQIEKTEQLIKTELNVKSIEYINDTEGVINKKVKPNFKVLGAKMGAKMKAVAAAISGMGQHEIGALEKAKSFSLAIGGEQVEIGIDDVEIIAEASSQQDGWSVANKDALTVVLDTTITPELQEEGNARELVNRIQKIRKESGLELTDHINVEIQGYEPLKSTIINFNDYICAEILADNIKIISNIINGIDIEVNEAILKVLIHKTS